MEDPSSQDLLLQFVLLVVLTFLKCFFSLLQRWLWFLLVAHVLNKRLKRGINAISVC